MKMFSCDFGGGVSCRFQAPDNAPVGSNHPARIEWKGKPTTAHLRQYVEWMNGANQQLADEWGVAFMHVFQITPAEAEAWTYTPGGKPTLLGTAPTKRPTA